MKELYHRYGPALRRKCERMLGNQQDAEDIVHTLFIDLLAKGRTDVSLPYLYRAVTTRCINRMRDRRRRQELLDEHGTASIVLRHGDVAERIVSVDLLQQLMQRLDDVHAPVFVHLFLDHMTQAEVADLVGATRKTVRARLTRIRAVLAELLEPADGV